MTASRVEAEGEAGAGESYRRRAIRHSAMMTAAAVGAFVCNFGRGLFTPYVLDPEGYGRLGVLSLIILYGGYLQLGMKHSATLLMPSAMRRGDSDQVEEIRDSVFTAENLLSVVVVMALWILYGAGVTFGGVVTLYFAATLSAVILLQRFDLLLGAYLKAQGRFAALAQNQFFKALLGMVFGIPLLWFYGIEGLIASMIIPYVFVDGYTVWNERIRFTARFDLGRIWAYTKIGFPVYVNNFVGAYLWTLEKTLIALLLSRTDLGIYSFALLVFGPIRLVPASFHEVIKRRMAEFRDELNPDGSNTLLRFQRFPMQGYLALSMIISGAAFFFYQVLVTRLYPTYAGSIPVLAVLLFGFPFFQVRFFTGYSLNLLDRRWLFLGLQCAAVLVNGVIDYVLIKRFGILGAAVGCSASYVVFAYATLYASHRATAAKRPGLASAALFGRLTLTWSIAFGVLVGLSAVADAWTPELGPFASVAFELGLALFCTVVFSVCVVSVFTVVFVGDRFHSKAVSLAGDVVAMARESIENLRRGSPHPLPVEGQS